MSVIHTSVWQTVDNISSCLFNFIYNVSVWTYDDDDVWSLIAKLIWSCEMQVTSECDTLIYDAKYCYAKYDADWYVCSHSCMKNYQPKDLWSTTSISVLYVYLFLEELII